MEPANIASGASKSSISYLDGSTLTSYGFTDGNFAPEFTFADGSTIQKIYYRDRAPANSGEMEAEAGADRVEIRLTGDSNILGPALVIVH